MSKKLKYLWIYSAANSWVMDWHGRLISRRKQLGYDVEGFCITPPSLNNRWLPFYELDKMWKKGDKKLIDLYKRLTEQLEDVDVLVLYNGANLHPEYLETLDCIKVFTAGDDPESTEILSKPVAKYFDVHLINNIAEVNTYKRWGLENVHFWPLGSLCFEEEVDLKFNVKDIGSRTIEGCFIGERQPSRDDKMNKICDQFPGSFFAGKGWDRGIIAWEKMWEVYRTSQLGWNMHRSTGPINFRTYELAAFGIMQLCDNKSDLGKIYSLDKEVIGFDSIDECIELTQEYLGNKSKQRDIAYNGWLRWKKDYTPDKVWEKLDYIVSDFVEKRDNSLKVIDSSLVYKQLKKQSKIRLYSMPKNIVKKLLRGNI